MAVVTAGHQLAAGVWVTAAVGSAAGAGLPVLAVLATGIYLVVALAFPSLTRRLPRSHTAMSVVRVRYPDGRGILRDVLKQVTERGFAVDELATTAHGGQQLLPGVPDGEAGDRPIVEVDPPGPRPGTGERPGRRALRAPGGQGSGRRGRGRRGGIRSRRVPAASASARLG